MTLRGLLCGVLGPQTFKHRPVRLWLLGYRCADCGRIAATELEMLGERDEYGRPAGYVSPGPRRRFTRDDRYRAAV
jgi:hypothetical protein